MIIEPDKHREFRRTSFDRHVNIEFIIDRYDNCQIKDLSLTGLFVKGDFKQEYVGTACRVNFVQNGISTNLSLQMGAKVVRKDDDGIAVKFCSMTFDSYMYLHASLLNVTENSISLSSLFAQTSPFEISE